MLKAAIDVGSNSFLLTIADVVEGKVTQVHEDQLQIVKLAQGLDKAGTFHPDALERAYKAFESFKDTCDKYGIPTESVRAGGTSAVREAKDSPEFRETVRSRYGFDIEVVTGENEGLYSWRGAVSTFDLPTDAIPCLVDIGGGSTEFSWNNGQDSLSLPMGVVRGKERHLHNDPASQAQLTALSSDMKGLLRQLPDITKPTPLIATAGTATTLAAVAGKIEPYDGSKVHGMYLSKQELLRQIDLYQTMGLEERKNIPGLHPSRAEVIIAGAQILLTVYDHFAVDTALVSDRGIRYGLLLSD